MTDLWNVYMAGERVAVVELADSQVSAFWARLRDPEATVRLAAWESGTVQHLTAARPSCPCCQRPLPRVTAVCGECDAAGCAGSEYATPELPYPYCAVTDSSPLA